jgi:hypothetical protein
MAAPPIKKTDRYTMAQGRWFVKRDRTVWVDEFGEKFEISA